MQRIPRGATLRGETRHAKRERIHTTPSSNNNPNLNPANGDGATNPFRLDRSQAVTSDQDHDYTAEQQAFDAGSARSVP